MTLKALRPQIAGEWWRKMRTVGEGGGGIWFSCHAQLWFHQLFNNFWMLLLRLISERTVEENILKKANQKRMLGDMAIEGGNFTTAFFKQVGIYSIWPNNSLSFS